MRKSHSPTARRSAAGRRARLPPRRSRSSNPSESDYWRLTEFRYALRRFLHFSEEAARQAGISPNQYQLLLFIRGFPGPPPTIADLSERLQVEHQSAVGLVDRSVAAGLVRRRADAQDRRRVRVLLEPRGARLLARLVSAHSPQFRRLASALWRATPS